MELVQTDINKLNQELRRIEREKDKNGDVEDKLNQSF